MSPEILWSLTFTCDEHSRRLSEADTFRTGEKCCGTFGGVCVEQQEAGHGDKSATESTCCTFTLAHSDIIWKILLASSQGVPDSLSTSFPPDVYDKKILSL